MKPSERLLQLATKPPPHFKVEITDEKEGKVTEVLYSGGDYQMAFDLATGARSREELRGNWIKFTDDSRVKWAVIS